MTGALLNLLSEGTCQDYHVVGMDRSLFKGCYRKPTNFGMEKVRVDPEHHGPHSQTKEREFVFRINKNTFDLLLDTHLVIVLPNVWSPIHADAKAGDERWRPFEFRWIEKLGFNVVKDVEIKIDNQVVQRFDGYYLQNMVEREFSEEKKKQVYEMIGHMTELNDPAAANGGHYPHASHKDAHGASGSLPLQVEPSIRSRALVVPIMGWYFFSSKQAVPLCCMKSSMADMSIHVTLRPLREWYIVKNVGSYDAGLPQHPQDHTERKHEAPSGGGGAATETIYQLHRFTKQPPLDEQWVEWHGHSSQTHPDFTVEGTNAYYGTESMGHDWSEVYMVTTNVALREEERAAFQSKKNEYLYKDVRKIEVLNAPLTNKFHMENAGLVSNLTVFLQRNDVNARNEWSNYTNWSRKGTREMPLVEPMSATALHNFGGNWDLQKSVLNLAASDHLFRTTGIYDVRNERRILRTFHFYLSTKERERENLASVMTGIEQFTKTRGSGDMDHMHFYSFELNTDPRDVSPSGVLNTTFFSKFEIEYSLYPPPVNTNLDFRLECNADDDIIFGTTEANFRTNGVYDYMYNLYIYIERYNKIVFENGEVNVAMKY